jgi:formate dehydrogenase iron-sulfur subunit
MMSDVCKHCVEAPCLESARPARSCGTEFDTVYIQEPACNGCRDCIAACPFGVIHVSAQKHIAQKCTFCYDRLQNGLVPACAQACPTKSIQFGPIAEPAARGRRAGRDPARAGGRRGAALRRRRQGPGRPERLLPADGHAETYGLPAEVVPRVPSRAVWPSSIKSIVTALVGALGVFLAFGRRRDDVARAEGSPAPRPGEA